MKMSLAPLMALSLLLTGCGMVNAEKLSKGAERFRQIQPGMKQAEAEARLGAPTRLFSDAHTRWTDENPKTGDVTALDVWSDSQGVIRRVSVVPRVANLKGRPLEDPVPLLENLDTNRSSYSPSNH